MNKQLLKDLMQTKKFINRFSDSKVRLIDKTGNLYTHKNNFFYKFMLSNVLDQSPYRNIIINNLHNCERIFPNSSLYTLDNLINIFQNKKEVDFQNTKKASKENLKNILSNFLPEETISTFESILSFSGPDSLISIQPTNNIKLTIKKENMSEFYTNCNSDLSYILFNDKNSKSKRDVIFLAFDGFLERDSDLHHLLLQSQQNENKMIVILCRGTNNYFVSNIKKTIISTKIPVLIYECPFSNDDPFLFQDLCSSLEVKPVCIEEGEIILKQIKEKMKIVQNITLYENKICFEVEESIRLKLFSEFNNLLADSKDEYKNYIMQRKKRISSKKVEVFVPKDQKKLIEDLKFSFMVYNSICKFGVVENNKQIFPKQLNDIVLKYSKLLYEQLKNISYVTKIDNKITEKNNGLQKENREQRGKIGKSSNKSIK